MKPSAKTAQAMATLTEAVIAKDAETVRNILEANGGKKGLMDASGGAPKLMAEAIRNEDIPTMRALRDVGGILISFENELRPLVRAQKMELFDACIEKGLDHLWSDDLKRSTWGCEFADLDDIEVFKKAMAKSKDPLLFLNQCNNDWNSPVTIAADSGKLGFFKDLLALGAIPNYKTARKTLSTGENVLMGKGMPTKLEALLEAGFNVNMPMRGGYSLLHAAGEKGYLHLCEALVRHGAHVNARSSNGSTPLLWAAQNPDCAALLMKNGANVHAVNDKGQNVLFLSIEQFTPFLLWQDMLDRDSPLYWGKDNEGNTLLHLATFWAREKRMPTWLIDGLCDRFLNEPNHRGRTPLHLIAESGDRSAIDLLLRKGADIEARDRQGLTPLMLAAAANDSDTCVQLIMAGANPNAQEMGGRTALDLAMESDKSEVYPILIAAGGVTQETDFRFAPETDETRYIIRDKLLVAAMKTNNVEYLLHHLAKNPNPSSEELQAAQKHLKKSGKKPEMAAILSSHMAQKSINDVLGKVTAPAGP